MNLRRPDGRLDISLIRAVAESIELVPFPLFRAAVKLDGREEHVAITSGFGDLLRHAEPIRKPRSYRGSLALASAYWSTTDDRHIPCESFHEFQAATHLDYCPDVVRILPQPFTLQLQFAQRAWSHTPDFAVHHVSGRVTIVDVTVLHRYLTNARLQRAFAYAALAADEGNVGYQLMTAPSDTYWANLTLLAYHRRQFGLDDKVLDEVTDRWQPGATIDALARSVRPRRLGIAAVLHQCWHHVLEVQLDGPLDDGSVVRRPGMGQLCMDMSDA